MTSAGIMASAVVTASAPTLPVTTGLRLWLDADDAASFTFGTGTAVSQWNDKSGNTRHATQGDSAQRPTRDGTQNGRTSVVFAVGRTLLSSPNPVTASDNFTTIVACKRTGGGTNSVVLHNGQTSGTGYGVMLRAGGANIGVLRAGIAVESTTTPDPAAAGVLTTQRSSGTWSMWLNGTATSLAATGSINAPTTYAHIASWEHTFAGDVYEVLMYDRVLTTTERQQVEAYLKSKWGTP